MQINWIEPLDFAEIISANYSTNDWILLYSGLSEDNRNSTSYIALFPKKKIITDDFFAAKKLVEKSEKKWFGYLSYEVGAQFEKMLKTKKSFIDLPKISLINFAVVLQFNHETKTLVAEFEDNKLLEKILSWKAVKPVNTKVETIELESNFTDKSYLAAITDIQKMIAEGDFYQTNLTRKFFGKFNQKQKPQTAFQLFADLAKTSPANYSSFLQLDGNFIISSSPELFIKVENGEILSRPIKGTAPRSASAKEDLENITNLQNSPKERAENLMIVDLVRNDLARISEPGSVEVKKLFEVTSYKNIHHMSSDVFGKLKKNITNFDALQACFPPGSMTGAPKIKAMEVAAKKEKINRGIYSGCIGFFEGKKTTNLSVVIRTLIISKTKFEFQVGGAITFDSMPGDELEEIFSKGKALRNILGLKKN